MATIRDDRNVSRVYYPSSKVVELSADCDANLFVDRTGAICTSANAQKAFGVNRYSRLSGQTAEIVTEGGQYAVKVAASATISDGDPLMISGTAGSVIEASGVAHIIVAYARSDVTTGAGDDAYILVDIVSPANVS